VGEPGNPLRRAGGLGDRHVAGEQVLEEPEADHDEGGDRDRDEDQDEERNDDVHGGGGVPDDVGAEHACDSAACAKHRHRAVRVHHSLQQGGDDARSQEEDQIAQVAHTVLDVIAEHPEEEHIADDVEPASVNEHRCHDRDQHFPACPAGEPGLAVHGVEELLRLERPGADEAVGIGWAGLEAVTDTVRLRLELLHGDPV